MAPALFRSLLQSTVKHLDIYDAHIPDDRDSLLTRDAEFQLKSLCTGDHVTSRKSGFHHNTLCLCSKHLQRFRRLQRSSKESDMKRRNPSETHSLQLDALQEASFFCAIGARESAERISAIVGAAPTLQALQLMLPRDTIAINNCQQLLAFSRSISQAVDVLKSNTQITKFILLWHSLMDDESV